MAARDLEQGAVGAAVAANVRRLRRRRDLSQQQLAELLDQLGRPLRASAVMKIESGDRRVDVDDLVAFAVALNVPLAALLLPDVGEDEEVAVVPTLAVPAWSAWKWAAGQHSLLTGLEDLSDAVVQRQEQDFAAERPLWVRLRAQQPMAQAAARVSWAVDRLLAMYVERPTKKNRVTLQLLGRSLDDALSWVRREVDQLEVEDATRG